MISMTGYAQAVKRNSSQSVQVILRSGNFKYLDIAVRNLFRENMLLEEKIKTEVKKKILRGKVEIQIILKKTAQGQVTIDEGVLAKYLSQIRRVARKYHLKNNMAVSDVMNLPHVIRWDEKSTNEEGLIIPAVREGINNLFQFRKKEGAAIRKETLANLKKLKSNISRIIKMKPGVKREGDSKSDIDEELSLIAFYIGKVEKIAGSSKSEPKGKSVDFLTQEILRELNAASSKTKNKATALLIVESKNYLERVREQAQNIE